MGIGNSGGQGLGRNAALGPEMDLVRRHEKEYLYRLTRIPGFGAVIIQHIWEMTGSFERVYYIEKMGLKKLGILRSEEKCRTYDRWEERFSGMVWEYNCLQGKGIHFVTSLDREYPKRFLHICDYPMGFYAKGELPDERCPTAAIIGAKNCSEYGKQAAGLIGKELARVGTRIVGDLVLDIDGAGHEDVLNGKERTYGVLGCGVNICYPKSNYYLYETIPFQGDALSELEPNEEPTVRNFPIHNHIISSLSNMILIMEVRERSGSLIAANLGLEQGREIFALPGRVTDNLSTECNEPIQSGVGILTSPEDVLDYTGTLHEKKCINREKDQKELAKIEKMVHSCLGSEPRRLEQIIMQTGLLAGHCMSVPLELELGGSVTGTPGQNYTKTTT